MTKIHVKQGFEFAKDIYQQKGREAWLQAAGQEIEKKGISLKIGEGSQAIEVKTAKDLTAFYERYKANPEKAGQEIGLPPGRNLREYVNDLMQAVDDIVKDTSKVQKGASIDLRATSELGKSLGLDQAERRYASSYTGFGQAAKSGAPVNVLGLLLYRDPVPHNPLEGVPFIDATTFAGSRQKTDRNSLEFESVRRIGGLDKNDLIGLLRAETNGTPAVNRMRKAKDAEAFTVGYNGLSMDQMRWDSDAHRVREANPHVSFVVEGGRLQLDERSGLHEVSLGTDYNEDTYYDTKDYSLLKNEMSIRGRVRRDDPNPDPSGVRRVLIQSKVGSAVDENGMKSAAKVDIRKDSPSAADIDGLDEAIRSGKSDWGWGMNRPKEPVEALAVVYDGLKEKGALQDIGENKGVLLLEEKSHVRSTRSRFHLNESNRQSTTDLFQKAGEPKIREVLDLVKGSNLAAPEAQKLTDLGQKILDKSLFVERCKDHLIALDPSLAQTGVTAETIKKLWPDQPVTSDKLEAAKRDVVAKAIKGAYDEFSASFDGQRRDIAGARGREVRDLDLSKEVIGFLKEKHPEMKSIQTVGPFLQKYDQIVAGSGKDAFLSEFGTWAAGKGKPALQQASDKDAALSGMRKHLVNEHLDILHRQIESSGTMAKTLSFDNFRKAYAGNERGYGNFIIDTFDISEFYTPEAWKNLSPEEKSGAKPVDPNKMFHAMVVNEVQIELGYEKPFVAAINKAKASLNQAKAEIFAEFATSKGLPVVAGQPETFKTALDGVLQKPAAERDRWLSDFQAFAAAKGSPLTVSANELQGLTTESFSSRLPLSVGSHKQLQEDLRMSEFIWSELRKSQEFIADLRGNRVTREAERAGKTVTWQNSEMSKGDMGLTLLRDSGR